MSNQSRSSTPHKETQSVGIQTDGQCANTAPRKRRKNQGNDNVAIDDYSGEERRYYRNLEAWQQEDINETERFIKDTNDDSVPVRFRVLSAKIPVEAKAIAIRKLESMSYMDSSSGEFCKLSQWMDAVCRIPFGKFVMPPVNAESNSTEIRAFLEQARKNLDKHVYGHIKAKDQIVRLMAQWVVKPDAKGLVIGLHGPPGAGKTLFASKGICETLKMPFALIPLGGASDAAFLEGHSYTYEGSTWGKIVDVLMRSKCMNPVLFFDELDKVSNTHRGQEIINILIHLCDQTQNTSFRDRYFTDFEFDLSKCLVIFSYNDPEQVNPILRDRMVRIEATGYGLSDKLAIVKKHLLPRALQEYGMQTTDIVLRDKIIEELITMVDEEQGVRNLLRGIHDIISHVNLNRLTTGQPELPYEVTSHDLKRFVSNIRTHARNTMMYL